ncbi:U3 snoRNP protein [Orobanche gracilis]
MLRMACGLGCHHTSKETSFAWTSSTGTDIKTSSSINTNRLGSSTPYKLETNQLMMTSHRLYYSRFEDKRLKLGHEADLSIVDVHPEVEDDANHHNLKLISDFLNEANEGILLEIFIRLPNCRSAIQFGSICQSWHSLISQPQFIPRINIYPRKKTSFYLDFLPSPMVVRASCDDLLLVSPDSSQLDANRYICNPITKQYYELPGIPGVRRCRSAFGHALLRINNNNQFKVVQLEITHFKSKMEPEVGSIPMWIYSSESGKWKRKWFPYPRPKVFRGILLYHIVSCNGIVYFLEYERDADRVLAFDLLNGETDVIVFPDDFWWFKHHQQQQQQDSCDAREQIGVVGRELRLSQAVLTGRGSIKVWKLNDKRSSWFLVHDKKKLTMPPGNQEDQLVASFLHPTDGGVIFMVWGTTLFRYDLITEEGEYEMIDELQESLDISEKRHWVYNDLLISFPLVYPPWPTPLPPAV